MSTKNEVVAITSDVNHERTQVYEGRQMVATLRHREGGWRTAYYRSGQDDDGRSVWTPVDDEDPLPLSDAAARAAALAAGQVEETPS